MGHSPGRALWPVCESWLRTTQENKVCDPNEAVGLSVLGLPATPTSATQDEKHRTASVQVGGQDAALVLEPQRQRLQAGRQLHAPSAFPRLCLVMSKCLHPKSQPQTFNSALSSAWKQGRPERLIHPFTTQPKKRGLERGSDLPRSQSQCSNPGLFSEGPGAFPHYHLQAPKAPSPGSPLLEACQEPGQRPCLAPYRLPQDGAVLLTLSLQRALGLLGLPQLSGQVLRADGRTGPS